MNMMEGLEEPEWILDSTGSGPLYWRRDCSNQNSRVKFRFDVEVKEFHRNAYELDDGEWSHYPETTTLTMGLTCIICIAVTVMLPWYIMIGTN